LTTTSRNRQDDSNKTARSVSTSSIERKMDIPSKKKDPIWIQVVQVVGILTFLGLTVACLLVVTKWKAQFLDLLKKISQFGLLGNLIFIGLFIVVSMPFGFGFAMLTISSGFIYRMFLGWGTSIVGAVAGAIISFVFDRMLIRNWFLETVKSKPKFLLIVNALESHGFKIAFFLRITPLPYGIQNALCAVSSISFKTYVVASFLGLIPETAMLTYLGVTTKNLTDLLNSGQFTLENMIFPIFQIILSICLSIFFIFVGKRALDKSLAQQKQEASTPLLQNTEECPNIVQQSTDESTQDCQFKQPQNNNHTAESV